MTLSRLAALLVLGWGLLGSTFAISVETVNLHRMVASADRIFYGQCVEALDQVDPELGLPVVVYRFRVESGLKGAEAGEFVEFRQLSGAQRQMSIPGMPGYRKGQTALLFLYPDSNWGLTSPVGLLQGIFRPEVLEDGRISLRNGLGNGNLGVDLDVSAAGGTGLTPEERRVLAGEGVLTLELMGRLVARFDGRSAGEVAR